MNEFQTPPGYRLLVQSADYATEADFRAWLSKCFGPTKGLAAHILPGFMWHVYVKEGKRNRREPMAMGFRAYLKEKDFPLNPWRTSAKA